MTNEARRKDASVVEHEQIAGAEMIGQSRERGVFDRPGMAREDQQPRLPSLRRRPLSDQLLGQVEIEIAGSE